MKPQHRKKIGYILSLSVLLTGCGKNNYQTQATGSQSVDQKNIFDRPECEINYYDVALDVDLWDYEFKSTNAFNFGIGFNTHTNMSVALDLNLKIDKANLQMQASPSNPYEALEPYTATATDKDVHFGVDVDFGKIQLGYQNYTTTPVAQLTRTGLMNAVQGLKDKVMSQPFYSEWSTRVLSTPLESRNLVVIQAGADAGISEGDRFEVYNIDHHWLHNNPCHDKYLGFSPETPWGQPVATLVATHSVISSRQFATLQIEDDRISNQTILPGAYVRQVPAAKGKKQKQLARSVKIGYLTSGTFQLMNGSKLDLSPYLAKQIDDVLQDKKWKGLFYRYNNSAL